MKSFISRFITLPLLVQLLVVILNHEYIEASSFKLRKGMVESINSTPVDNKKLDAPYLIIKPKPSKSAKNMKPVEPKEPEDPIEPTKPVTDNDDDNEETTGCTTTECFCNDHYDIVILAEASSFSGSEIWMQTFKPFIRSLASKFKITKEDIHLAVALYASNTEQYISFVDPESTDKKALLTKIDNITEDYIGKIHNVLYTDSLYYALDDMLFKEGTRKDVGKVSILFNYGFDNNKNDMIVEDVVNAYKDRSVHLLTIGMENSLNGNQNMYLLAGCSDNDTGCPRTVIVEYENIFSAARETKVKICKSMKIENLLDN